jgi:predicted SprT family Zn-dependent metalloprotease
MGFGGPKFPESGMKSNQLRVAIIEYQKWCAKECDCLNIDLTDVPVEISHKMKRAAGKVSRKGGASEVNYIRYAKRAYDKWGWEQFSGTVRHELIHVHTIQNHGEGGHGHHFKALVDQMDTHRHCENFSEDIAKFHLFCSECGKKVADRHRKSKTVKQPEKYQSKCCKQPLRVEDNR